MAAFNPGGAESLAGKTFDQQRNRQEGYLYWAAWVAQTGGSLFGTADGQGVFRRFTRRRQQLRHADRLRPALGRDQPPRRRGALLAVIKETPSPGRIVAMVAFAFSCVGILLFLWLSFGGPVPLRVGVLPVQGGRARGHVAGRGERRAHLRA